MTKKSRPLDNESLMVGDQRYGIVNVIADGYEGHFRDFYTALANLPNLSGR